MSVRFEAGGSYARLKEALMAILLGRGLMAVRQLVLVPVLIHAWGVNYYGAWLMLSALPTFLSMSNLGLGSSTNIKVGIDVAAGNRVGAAQAFATGQWILLVACCVSVGLVYASAGYFDLGRGLIDRSAIVTALLLAGVFVQMLCVTMMGWWVGIGRPSRGHDFLNLQSALVFFASLAVPLLGGDAFHLAWASLVAGLLGYALFAHFTAKNAGFSAWGWGLSLVRRRVAGELLGKGLGYQLSALWQALLFQGGLVIAGLQLGEATAALLGAVRVLVRAGNQLVEVVGIGFASEMLLVHAHGDRAAVVRAFSAGLFMSVAGASLIAMGIMLCGPIVFGWWTSGNFDVPYAVWAVFAVSLLPYSIWSLGAALQRAMNMPWYMNGVGVAAALLAVSVMWCFGEKGVVVFALSALLFEVIVWAAMAPVVKRQVGLGLLPALAQGGGLAWTKAGLILTAWRNRAR